MFGPLSTLLSLITPNSKNCANILDQQKLESHTSFKTKCKNDPQPRDSSQSYKLLHYLNQHKLFEPVKKILKNNAVFHRNLCQDAKIILLARLLLLLKENNQICSNQVNSMSDYRRHL